MSRYPPIATEVLKTNCVGTLFGTLPPSKLAEVPMQFLPSGTAAPAGTGTRGLQIPGTNTFGISIMPVATPADKIMFSAKIPTDCVLAETAGIYAQVVADANEAAATDNVMFSTLITLTDNNTATSVSTVFSVETRPAVGWIENGIYIIPIATFPPSMAGANGMVSCQLARGSLADITHTVYGGDVWFVNAMVRYVSNGSMDTRNILTSL
jgi:hypothetical protein